MVDFTAIETKEQSEWRQEVRDFLRSEPPPDFDWDYDEDDAGWATMQAWWRKVGKKGWVSPGWPKQYYGLDRPAIDKWILMDEFANAKAPDYPGIGMSVADHVIRLGTHEQRLKHLKGIASAEIVWGEGFTEPEAGSDLASLETRAVRDGDEWVINGQKTFGTAAHRSQWMLVFARTDPSVPKHAGLTCFVVPLDTPGITMQPLWNIAGGRQNQTFFDNVRVPLDAVIGEVNRAWQQVWFRIGGERLDRGGPSPSLRSIKLYHAFEVIKEYCRDTVRNGKPLSQDSHIRMLLAELQIGVEHVRLLDYEAFWQFTAKEPSPYGGYLSQAVYKELEPRFAQICMEILGPLAQVQLGTFAPAGGVFDRNYRASFGNHAGGTSQLKRMVLATRGLGLPR